MTEKTHYRKAFNSPYLSSADVVGEVGLTIKRVALEPDQTKKTKDLFNTAYFVEKEIRHGEPLKPMILNATNSKMLRHITDSPYIDDWQNVPITVYVDPSVKFGRETVEGLRVRMRQPRPEVKPGTQMWENAKTAFVRDGNFSKVLEKADISEENQNRLREECASADS